jgi:hypothetical protein
MGHEILNSIDELIGMKCEFYDDDYYKGTFTIIGHEVSIEDFPKTISIVAKLKPNGDYKYDADEWSDIQNDCFNFNDLHLI